MVKWLAKKGVEKIQEVHQLAITDCDNQIQAIQYENVALQAQRDVYQTQLQAYKDHPSSILEDVM